MGASDVNYHHQNLTDGRLPIWRHGRAWLWLIAWEWVVFKRCTFGIEIGLRHANIRLGIVALYVNRRGLETETCRSFEVSFHDGCIRIGHPWASKIYWSSRDPWWRRDIVLRVSDWLLGRRQCEVIKGERSTVYVPLPEGCYAATAERQTYTWRRRFYVPVLRRESVYLEIDGGIPYAGKGESSWDCGDSGLCGISGDDVESAIGNAVASVLKSRRCYGLDQRQTGSAPAIILNEKAVAT